MEVDKQGAVSADEAIDPRMFEGVVKEEEDEEVIGGTRLRTMKDTNIISSTRSSRIHSVQSPLSSLYSTIFSKYPGVYILPPSL